jgi:large subunit ribosomal protein L6
MSRIGSKPIDVPAGVDINFSNGILTVKGAKGELTQAIHPNMKIVQGENSILVERLDDHKFNRSLHGLTRSLINNMVTGVTTGFKKILEVNGVGYRVQKQGKELVMNLGFSHKVVVPDTNDVTTEVEGNKITVLGADKQKVGQFAAQIREKRPPEPYKGKGIKYIDEVIRRKEGKAGKS